MASQKDTKTEEPKNGMTSPAEPAPTEPVIGSGGSLTLEIDGLTYSLDRLPKKTGNRRSVITVSPTGSTDPKRAVIDKLDLFSFRSRKAFAGHVADALGRNEGDVIGHLSFIVFTVERAASKESKPAPLVLTGTRRRAAEKLLGSRDLLNKATAVMTERGYVGEETNKPLVYLVATSRLLAKPASAILRAESAAGKSELLDRVTELFPEESVEFLSRITPHALYYAGADHLKHKLVVVDEAAGTTEADYAIRTMQTKGLLRLALSVKGKTENFEARGPIALLSGTTSPDLNPENLSRCLSLALDESPEQTARVQAAQRRAWAGRETKGAADIEVWKDAQRLLEPLDVVIPFAERLSFPARTTSDRRDNAKLLTLVAAHALLFQRQRKRDGSGRVVASVEDYAAVYALVRPVIESSLDGLSEKPTKLYQMLVKEKLGESLFTRRETVAATGWPYMTVTRSIAELVAHELVAVVPGAEKPIRFRLIDRSVLGSAASLTPPEALR